MSLRYEIRLSGTGGQGVVLAGIILAEAAGRWREGQYVVQTVTYGPQVRGGLSSAEIVISPEEIDYPKPIQLDFLVPFTQEAAQESAPMLKKSGIVLADPELVYHAPSGWMAEIPLTAMARELTGRGQMANIVALGAMAVLTPVIDLESLEAALRERAPGRLREPFINAARAGARKAEEIKDSIFFEEEASPDD
jgi:2-oxoglutarate ferredoxin oxidoreductase subunit gamma